MYREHRDLDKQGGNQVSGNLGIAELNNFIDNNNLIDTWRKARPNERIFTWNNKDFTLRSRLDRWYIPEKLHQNTASCVRACPHSDNSVVETNFNTDTSNTRGKGVWKLNNDLLKDWAFQREVRAFQTFWNGKKTGIFKHTRVVG